MMRLLMIILLLSLCSAEEEMTITVLGLGGMVRFALCALLVLRRNSGHVRSSYVRACMYSS